MDRTREEGAQETQEKPGRSGNETRSWGLGRFRKDRRMGQLRGNERAPGEQGRKEWGRAAQKSEGNHAPKGKAQEHARVRAVLVGQARLGVFGGEGGLILLQAVTETRARLLRAQSWSLQGPLAIRTLLHTSGRCEVHQRGIDQVRSEMQYRARIAPTGTMRARPSGVFLANLVANLVPNATGACCRDTTGTIHYR